MTEVSRLFWHGSGTRSLACAYVFSVTFDSDMGRRLEPVSVKMDPAVRKAKYITPALVLGVVPLLLANWFIAATILGRDCAVLYEGGNITECGGGLSEEEMSAASGLIALVMLAIQIGLTVLLRRRIRSGPR
ncbi:hypothetical protein [Streptosporangium saharense]|uniref:Uncharacterized protein n=1 Tax=Streptosporangium saharense TaxID=1706840 RepID=A0A7W7QHN2_9ACTN|nr:hypothetical protein [Streptosporangium saharense]MBB4913713.1 hypothetical protein [Streptosporangium saharense]